MSDMVFDIFIKNIRILMQIPLIFCMLIGPTDYTFALILIIIEDHTGDKS